MNVIRVAVADLGEGNALPVAQVIIEVQLPDRWDSMEEHDAYFNGEAERIAETLFEHLPSGTFDRLAVKLSALAILGHTPGTRRPKMDMGRE